MNTAYLHLLFAFKRCSNFSTEDLSLYLNTESTNSIILIGNLLYDSNYSRKDMPRAIQFIDKVCAKLWSITSYNITEQAWIRFYFFCKIGLNYVEYYTQVNMHYQFLPKIFTTNTDVLEIVYFSKKLMSQVTFYLSQES